LVTKPKKRGKKKKKKTAVTPGDFAFNNLPEEEEGEDEDQEPAIIELGKKDEDKDLSI
jgi:hypothetical protein